MGFYEYDRVRSKNAVHNAAYNLHENLKAEGFSPQQVISYCNEELKGCDSYRYEIIMTVLNTVRRSRIGELY